MQKDGELFLHVYTIPDDHRLLLPNNLPAFSKATVLESSQPVPIERSQDGAVLLLNGIVADDYITVIRLSNDE